MKKVIYENGGFAIVDDGRANFMYGIYCKVDGEYKFMSGGTHLGAAFAIVNSLASSSNGTEYLAEQRK